MIEWWESLGFIEQLFYCVGIVATLVAFLVVILTFLGSDFGMDTEIEFDAEAENPSGLKFLSVHTIAIFLVGLGWVGGSVMGTTGSASLALLAGGGAGLAGAVLIFYLLSKMRSFDERFNMDLSNAVGQTAKVYIPIPANRGGEGQVELTFQGRYRVMAAVTSSGVPLEAQTPVLVVDLAEDNVLVVRPLEQTLLPTNSQPQLQP
ncbi:MAG: hypothetical protein AAGK14_13485 [Verrucomicrobiota bacterium]